MKLLMFLILISVSAAPYKHIFAHSNHRNKKYVGLKKIKAEARKNIKRLILEKKLSSSWEHAVLTNDKELKPNKYSEYMLIYLNSKESDPEKKNLYVFVNVYGKFLAAKFKAK